MIRENELRMGVLIEKDDIIYKFLSLEKNHASTSEYRMYWVETLDGKLGKYYSTHFNPIPLESETLQKSGYYNYDEENNRWIHTKHIGFGDYYMDEKLLYFGTSCVKVEYLHELQNLIYVLTGQELEIDLN